MRQISETLGKKEWFVQEIESAERMPSTVRNAFLNLASRIEDMLESRREYLHVMRGVDKS